MDDVKTKEYLMLRDEIQTNLKSQQSWSTFSIASVLTLLGVAANMNFAPMYLMPVIVLLLAAVKVRNYRFSTMQMAAYMIVRIENPDGFYWETSLNELRYRNMNPTGKHKHMQNAFNKIIHFLETQEFAFMGTICLIIYIIQSLKGGLGTASDIVQFVVLVVLALIALGFIIVLSMNYWNMNPETIDEKQEMWREILASKNCNLINNEK